MLELGRVLYFSGHLYEETSKPIALDCPLPELWTTTIHEPWGLSSESSIIIQYL